VEPLIKKFTREIVLVASVRVDGLNVAFAGAIIGAIVGDVG